MSTFTDSRRPALDQLLEDSSFYTNPYPVFSRLRDEAPVYWHQASRTWLVARYDDVDFVLHSPQLFSNYGFQNAYFENLLPELRAAAPTLELRGRSPSLLTSDPPAHTRLRRLLHSVFSPKAIEELRPRVQTLVQRLLDDADNADKNDEVIDCVATLAHPLPAMLIADIMGVPREDHRVFKKVSGDLLDFMNRPNPNAELTVEFAREADNSLASLRDYLRGIMADRRRHPRNDVISILSQADFDGDRLTEEELLSNLVLFLIAGHEMTTSLIANGILLFARHPDQLQAIRVQRELVNPAIEEIMRFESPVQRQRRIVAQDLELGGATLRRGQQLEVLLGSANRDHKRWENPDRFDIRRKPVPHIAFGKGIHFCIGAQLARLEAQVVFNDQLNRFSGFEVPTGREPSWMANTNLRKPDALPVRVRREA